MRIVKSLSIAAILFLLGAASLSAKPVSDRAEADQRIAFRNEAIGGCIDTGLPQPAPQLVGDMLRRTCTCAVDRYMDGRPTVTLPETYPAMVGRLAYLELRQCAREVITGQVAAPAAPSEETAATAESSGPSGTVAPSSDKPEEAGAAAPADSGPSLLSRLLARVDASGIPRAGWIALAILGFVLLRLLFRRRQSDDLLGPPRWMRPGSRPPPPPPPPTRI